jgi:hypothetical protein
MTESLFFIVNYIKVRINKIVRVTKGVSFYEESKVYPARKDY